MTVSSIAVTEGSGRNLHTSQRTISSTAREDQYIQQGESDYPTFSAIAGNISIATSGDHVLFIQADGTNYTRLKRFRISPTNDVPASASVARFQVKRTSTAGSGGSSVTARPYDTADSYSGTIQTLPSSKGTEGAILYDDWLAIPSTLGDHLDKIDWVYLPGMKPIIFGSGAGNGICFLIFTGIASCTVNIVAEFVVTSYL